MDAQLRVGGKAVRLSNLEKVLYPAAGTTKREIINYYQEIAEVMLPHLRRRPVTLKRYPNGVDSSFFYEKRCPPHRPDWVSVAEIPWEGDEPLLSCLINNSAALVWAANLAAIELHTQLHRVTSLGRPSFVVFDLDPGAPATLMDCISVALDMRDLLLDLGLKSYPKVSGGKGLHFYVPLNTPVTFDRTKTFAQTVARAMEEHHPKLVTSNMNRARRAGKVFVDWSQNDDHKTTVCVYSLRAFSQPAVSMPVTWEQLQRAKSRRSLKSLVFSPDRAFAQTQEHGDLFADVLTLKQRLP